MKPSFGLFRSRISSGFCFVALFCAALANASDPPWKGKPYDQWDDKDIQRIFMDSPWGRTTTITRTWLPINAKDDLPNVPLEGRDRGLPGSTERSAETTVGGELNVYVFWASSRVMRAATARRSILRGGKADLDLEKYAAEPQAEYQVVVQAEDMAPFLRHDEKSFQSAAFLDMKKGKQRLSPSHVQYERDDKRVLVTSAIFFFPKQNSSGAPTISADEKNVDFVLRIESSTLRVGFEPQKMVDKTGSAL